MLIAILSEIYINVQERQEAIGRVGLTSIEFDEWIKYLKHKNKPRKWKIPFFRTSSVEENQLELIPISAELSEPNHLTLSIDEEDNNSDPEGKKPYDVDLEELADKWREMRAEKSNKASVAQQMQEMDTKMNEGFSK